MNTIQNFEPLWGGWRTVQPLGQGTYGTVWSAESNGNQSAIKHISISANDPSLPAASSSEVALLESLLREVRTCDQLNDCINLVPYDAHYYTPKANNQGFDVFLKTELLTSLPRHWEQQSITLGDCLELGIDLCSALSVLHQNNTVHRNIKPSNIFRNKQGDYKLGDLAMAQVFGTVANDYSAPEICNGEGFNETADIYSLGLVMYRLLNHNRGPFTPLPPQSLTEDAIRSGEEKRRQGATLPAPALADATLAKIIAIACAYAPKDRWLNVGILQHSLRNYRSKLTNARLETVLLPALGITEETAPPQPHEIPVVAPAPTSQQPHEIPVVAPAPAPPQPHEIPVVAPAPTAQQPQVVPVAPPPAPPQPHEIPVVAPAPTSQQPQVVPIAPPQKKKSDHPLNNHKMWLWMLSGVVAGLAILAVVIFATKSASETDVVVVDNPTNQESQTVIQTMTVDETILLEEEIQEPLSEDVIQEVPEMPEVPEDSEIPEMPEMPEIPEMPEMPEIPLPPDLSETEGELDEREEAPAPAEEPPSPAKEETKPATTTTTTVVSPAPVEEVVSEPETPAEVTVTGIQLSPASMLLGVGATGSLQATVLPAGITGQQVQWSSSNPAVAQVQGGMVIAYGSGTTIITASCGGFSATCAVSVS